MQHTRDLNNLELKIASNYAHAANKIAANPQFISGFDVTIVACLQLWIGGTTCVSYRA